MAFLRYLGIYLVKYLQSLYLKIIMLYILYIYIYIYQTSVSHVIYHIYSVSSRNSCGIIIYVVCICMARPNQCLICI